MIRDRLKLSSKINKFVLEQLLKYNISKLRWITISRTNAQEVSKIIRGVCIQYTNDTYRICICVNPSKRLYPLRYLNPGLSNTKKGKYYHPERLYIHKNPEDALIHLIGHEVFHFLVWTGQAKGKRNTEYNANAFGDKWLREYRKFNP